MADELIKKLSVDVSGADKSLNDLAASIDKTLKDIEKSIKEATTLFTKSAETLADKLISVETELANKTEQIMKAISDKRVGIQANEAKQINELLKKGLVEEISLNGQKIAEAVKTTTKLIKEEKKRTDIVESENQIRLQQIKNDGAIALEREKQRTDTVKTQNKIRKQDDKAANDYLVQQEAQTTERIKYENDIRRQDNQATNKLITEYEKQETENIKSENKIRQQDNKLTNDLYLEDEKLRIMKEIEDYKVALREQTDERRQAQKERNAIAREEKTHEKAIVSQSYKDFLVEQKDYNDAYEDYLKAEETLSKQYWDGVKETANDALNVYTQVMQKIVNVIKNAFTDAISYVEEYDAALTSIALVKGDASIKSSLGQDLENMAQDMSVTATELASAAEELYRQGLDDNQVMGRLGTITQYAKISGETFKSSVEVITAAVNSFTRETEDAADTAQRVVDVWSYLGDAVATSSSEIGVAMQKVAASGQAAGFDLEELSSIISVIESKTRLAAENVGTALNSMMSRYMKVTAKGWGSVVTTDEGDVVLINDIAKALSSVGIEIYDAKDGFKDFSDVLEELSPIWNGLEDANRNYIATQMAGTRNLNIFLSMMNDYSEALNLTNEAYNAAGTGAQKYGIWMGGVEAAQNRLTAALQDFYSEVITSDVMIDFIDNLTAIVKWLRDATDAMDGLNIGAGVTTAGIAMLVLTIAKLINMAKTLPNVFSILIKSLTTSTTTAKAMTAATGAATIGMTALQTAMVSVGVGLVIAGIVSLVGYLTTLGDSAKEAAEAVAATTEKLAENDNSAKHVDEIIKRLDELGKKSSYTTDEMEKFNKVRSEIAELSPDIAEYYGIEADALGDLGAEYDATAQAAKRLREEQQRQDWLVAFDGMNDAVKSYENARKILEGLNSSEGANLTLGDDYGTAGWKFYFPSYVEDIEAAAKFVPNSEDVDHLKSLMAFIDKNINGYTEYLSDAYRQTTGVGLGNKTTQGIINEIKDAKSNRNDYSSSPGISEKNAQAGKEEAIELEALLNREKDDLEKLSKITDVKQRVQSRLDELRQQQEDMLKNTRAIIIEGNSDISAVDNIGIDLYGRVLDSMINTDWDATLTSEKISDKVREYWGNITDDIQTSIREFYTDSDALIAGIPSSGITQEIYDKLLSIKDEGTILSEDIGFDITPQIINAYIASFEQTRESLYDTLGERISDGSSQKFMKNLIDGAGFSQAVQESLTSAINNKNLDIPSILVLLKDMINAESESEQLDILFKINPEIDTDEVVKSTSEIFAELKKKMDTANSLKDIYINYSIDTETPLSTSDIEKIISASELYEVTLGDLSTKQGQLNAASKVYEAIISANSDSFTQFGVSFMSVSEMMEAALAGVNSETANLADKIKWLNDASTAVGKLQNMAAFISISDSGLDNDGILELAEYAEYYGVELEKISTEEEQLSAIGLILSKIFRDNAEAFKKNGIAIKSYGESVDAANQEMLDGYKEAKAEAEKLFTMQDSLAAGSAYESRDSLVNAYPELVGYLGDEVEFNKQVDILLQKKLVWLREAIAKYGDLADAAAKSEPPTKYEKAGTAIDAYDDLNKMRGMQAEIFVGGEVDASELEEVVKYAEKYGAELGDLSTKSGVYATLVQAMTIAFRENGLAIKGMGLDLISWSEAVESARSELSETAYNEAKAKLDDMQMLTDAISGLTYDGELDSGTLDALIEKYPELSEYKGDMNALTEAAKILLGEEKEAYAALLEKYGLVVESTESLSDALDKEIGSANKARTAQDKLGRGLKLTAAECSTLIDAYPELTEAILDYANGTKSAASLMGDLDAAAKNADVSNFTDSIVGAMDRLDNATEGTYEYTAALQQMGYLFTNGLGDMTSLDFASTYLDDIRAAIDGDIDAFYRLQQASIINIVGSANVDFSAIENGLITVKNTTEAALEQLAKMGLFEIKTDTLENQFPVQTGVDLATGMPIYDTTTILTKISTLQPTGSNPFKRSSSGGGGGSSGGGGGGGGGKSSKSPASVSKKTKKAIDKSDEEIDAIDYQLQMAKAWQEYYESTGELGKAIPAIEKQIELYKEMLATYEENSAELQTLADAKKNEIAQNDAQIEHYTKLRDQYVKGSAKYDEYNKKIKDLKTQNEGLTEDYDALIEAINKYGLDSLEVRKLIEESSKAIVDQRNAILQTVVDVKNTLKGYFDDIKEKEEKQRDATISMQNEIMETLRENARKKIELEKETLESKKETLEDELSAIRDNFNKARELAEENETANTLEEKQKQLALVLADPTKAKERAQLEKEIAELQNDIAWEEADAEISRQEDDIQKQIDEIDLQISALEEAYDAIDEYSEEMVKQMQDIMKMSSDDVVEWLKKNSTTYGESTKEQQEKMVDDWKKTMATINDEITDPWKDVDDIIGKGIDAAIEKLKQSSGFINASVEEQQLMIENLKKLWDAMDKAKNPTTGDDDDDGGDDSDDDTDTPTPGEQKEPVDPTLDATTKKKGGKLRKKPKDSSKVLEEIPGKTKVTLVGYNGKWFKTSYDGDDGWIHADDLKGTVDKTKLKKITKYKTGGLIDFTGPAWVDGTPGAPESILSATQTAIIRDFAIALEKWSMPAISAGDTNYGGMSVEKGAITINVAAMDKQTDIEDVTEKLMTAIYEKFKVRR